MKTLLLSFYLIFLLIYNESLVCSKLNQSNLAQLWSSLFTVARGSNCATAAIKAEVVTAYASGPDEKFKGVRSQKAEFSWIKKWGYDESAYLFDFFDPVLQSLAVTEFQKIYTDLMKLPSQDTKDYQDAFDIQKLKSTDDSHQRNFNLKHLNKNYDPALYSISVNSVQLNTAMKSWNWFISPGQEDYAVDFILKYDFNGDGRLNPRELIIGAILHNINDMVSGNCKNCLQGIAKTLDAIFLYLDCQNQGMLSSEQLWTSLPKLNRGTERWNVFSISTHQNIRTSAINDFIIKNGVGKEGSINRDEFRKGILLGYWDRQTSMSSIIGDDSRNLKNLRWDRAGLKDNVAFKYLKETELAKLLK